MAIAIENPLEWPAQMPHTPRGRQSNLHGFPNVTIEDAVQYLDDELKKFNPLRTVLTTHIEHFASPRLRKLEGTSSAISVVMKTENGERYIFACDRWLMPQHNIYAIVMTLRQIYAVHGYGLMDADTLLAHFIEKKPQETVHPTQPIYSGELEAWRTLLGLGPTASLSDANAVYRARARTIGEHDVHALATLNDAIDQARHTLKD